MSRFVPIPPKADEGAFREFSGYLADLRRSYRAVGRDRMEGLLRDKNHVVYAGRLGGVDLYNITKAGLAFVRDWDHRLDDISTHDAVAIERKMLNVVTHPEGGDPPKGGRLWHTNMEDTRWQLFYDWNPRNRLVTLARYVHHDDYGKETRMR